MPYRNQYDIAFGGDGDLRQRVALSIVAQAQTIYATSTASTTVNVARRALANRVLNDPAAHIDQFLYVAALGGQTDAAVDASVTAVWNAMAGA